MNCREIYRRLFSLLFAACFLSSLQAQKFEAELGYKFNNDFTTYYKDLKPFYYSGATFDLLVKHKRSEYILGLRYMPFLSSVMPEFGYNYYLSHDPDQKFNYFLHTTLFYNRYSYNNKVQYEHYDYLYKGLKPADYSTVKFTSFVHDIALGVKMGINTKWTIDFMVGSGYFYGKRDYAEGIIAEKTRGEYLGIQYNFRFAVKYVIFDRNGTRENNDE